MNSADTTTDACPAGAICAAVRGALRGTLVVLLPLLAGTLLARRLAGAFDARISTWAVLATIGLACLAALAIRWPPRNPGGWPQGLSRTVQLKWLAGWLATLVPSLSLLILAGTLSATRISRPARVGSWLLVFVEEVLFWGWIYGPAIRQRWWPALERTPEPPAPASAVAPLAQPSELNEATNKAIEDEATEDEATENAASDDVTQQFVRRIDAQGHESLSGLLRVHFVPGQRIAQAHLGFCPPLPATPTIEFEQVEGPPARVKLAQVFPYGARFEIKLDRPAPSAGDAAGEDAPRVGLDFVASVTAASVSVPGAQGE